MEALKTVLATVTSLSAANMTDEPIAISAIPEDKLPFCVIEEQGEANIDRTVTSTREIVLDVAILVYYRTAEDAVGGGQDIADSMVKKLEAACTGLLSATVSNIEVLPAPFGAVNAKTIGKGMKVRARLVRLYLEQDFT